LSDPRGAGRWAAGWIALLLGSAWSMAWFAPARAGTVVVLRAGSSTANEETAAGFRLAFRGTFQEIGLDADETALAARLEALRPDAIVAIGLRAALFARDRMPRTPLVFASVLEPERHGLMGAHITGVSAAVSPRSQLEALRGVAPDVKRVTIVMGPRVRADLSRSLRSASAETGIEIDPIEITDLAELGARVREAASKTGALWLPADPTVATPETFSFMLKLSLERRQPLIVFNDALVREGALLAACPDYREVGGQIADLVRRIQGGERAGDIPVAPPRRTRVVVNQSTARAIGRLIPVAEVGVEVIR
jgi:putative ABC transport system substrate-binding protein